MQVLLFHLLCHQVVMSSLALIPIYVQRRMVIHTTWAATGIPLAMLAPMDAKNQLITERIQAVGHATTVTLMLQLVQLLTMIAEMEMLRE